MFTEASFMHKHKNVENHLESIHEILELLRTQNDRNPFEQTVKHLLSQTNYLNRDQEVCLHTVKAHRILTFE